MAKTTAFGVDGDVTLFTNHNLNFEGWVLTVSQEIVDETGYDSGGWAETKGTIKSAAFSATGFPQYDAASTNPGVGSITAAGGTVTFQVATGCTYSFSGVVTSAGHASSLRGQSRVTYTGVTNGAITTVWDETP